MNTQSLNELSQAEQEILNKRKSTNLKHRIDYLLSYSDMTHLPRIYTPADNPAVIEILKRYENTYQNELQWLHDKNWEFIKMDEKEQYAWDHKINPFRNTITTIRDMALQDCKLNGHLLPFEKEPHPYDLEDLLETAENTGYYIIHPSYQKTLEKTKQSLSREIGLFQEKEAESYYPILFGYDPDPHDSLSETENSEALMHLLTKTLQNPVLYDPRNNQNKSVFALLYEDKNIQYKNGIREKDFKTSFQDLKEPVQEAFSKDIAHILNTLLYHMEIEPFLYDADSLQSKENAPDFTQTTQQIKINPAVSDAIAFSIYDEKCRKHQRTGAMDKPNYKRPDYYLPYTALSEKDKQPYRQCAELAIHTLINNGYDLTPHLHTVNQYGWLTKTDIITPANETNAALNEKNQLALYRINKSRAHNLAAIDEILLMDFFLNDQDRNNLLKRRQAETNDHKMFVQYLQNSNIQFQALTPDAQNFLMMDESQYRNALSENNRMLSEKFSQDIAKQLKEINPPCTPSHLIHQKAEFLTEEFKDMLDTTYTIGLIVPEPSFQKSLQEAYKQDLHSLEQENTLNAFMRLSTSSKPASAKTKSKSFDLEL